MTDPDPIITAACVALADAMTLANVDLTDAIQWLRRDCVGSTAGDAAVNLREIATHCARYADVEGSGVRHDALLAIVVASSIMARAFDNHATAIGALYASAAQHLVTAPTSPVAIAAVPVATTSHAPDLYAVYLATACGIGWAPAFNFAGINNAAITAPVWLAVRLGQIAATTGAPEDRLTVEATIAANLNTGRGFDDGAAKAYLTLAPMPMSAKAHDQALWLARAVQALGALPVAT